MYLIKKPNDERIGEFIESQSRLESVCAAKTKTICEGIDAGDASRCHRSVRTTMKNLFADLPTDLPEEVVEVLAENNHAADNGFQSIAFPQIGVGSGSFNQEKAKEIMLDELQSLESPLDVTVVVFKKP